MSTYYTPSPRSDELFHYGRLGMKWGQHIFGRYANDDIRKYQKRDGRLTRAGKKKQANRDVDIKRLSNARKNESDKLNYYRSFKTASDDEVYRNVKRDIERGEYTETGHSFTRSKKYIAEARAQYVKSIPDQEKLVKHLDDWIDRHKNTPLNRLTPLEQMRERNSRELHESLRRHLKNR